MKKELAIIIPVYNEEIEIENVIKDWSKVLPQEKFDLILINDGSKDNTLSIILKQKKLIKNLILLDQKNQGHGKTICDGYIYASEKDYKFIFQTDSDGQFFSSDFSKIWENRKKNDHDIILGERYKRNDPLLRIFLSKVILRTLLKVFFKKNINDPNIPYRLINSNFMRDFLTINPSRFIAPNIIMSIHAKKIFFTKVKHAKRMHGEIKWPLKKLFKFGISLFKDLKDYYSYFK